MSADILPAGPKAYARAAAIFAGGGLVALPTETVYGLAANARDDNAVAKIYAAKGRPSHNPLIAHVLSPSHAADYAEISPLAVKLINAFWPGPLTLVLPRKSAVLSDTASAGLTTIALRCPDAPWRNALLENGFSGPLFMPSANNSGHISPTTAPHVADDLGEKIDLIIDGGPCPGGLESTILKIEDDQAVLLRPGTLTADEFVPYISDLRLPKRNAAISAPGMLESHYAPRASVRLNAKERGNNEVYLGFGAHEFTPDMTLSETGEINEAARNLYAALRSLDDIAAITGASIAVAPIPEIGVGAALNDRLRRAAAQR